MIPERKDMGPLISVIVPVYKVEKYLNRCVESIVSQSYRKLEILLIDDGSPDLCGQMCDTWAERDDRIRVIHKVNGGAADARNIGIQNANGEYITFVDSDDFIAPKMIEQLYLAIKETDTKMAMCNTVCLDQNGDYTDGSDSKIIPNGIRPAEEVLPLLYRAWGTLYIVPWNKLIHHSLLSDHFFPVGKGREDEFVAAQLIWAAQTIAGTSYTGYYYILEREGSAMQSWSKLQRLDYLEALLIRYRFYQEIGQTALLHETRARVLKALEEYYGSDSRGDPDYDAKMEQLREGYNSLTGLPLKEWLKWKVFQVNPKLEYFITQKFRRRPRVQEKHT